MCPSTTFTVEDLNYTANFKKEQTDITHLHYILFDFPVLTKSESKPSGGYVDLLHTRGAGRRKQA